MINYDEIIRLNKKSKRKIPKEKRFDVIRIKAVSKSTGYETTLIAKSLEDAKEKFGDKFKDFKMLGYKDELDSKKHKPWD